VTSAVAQFPELVFLDKTRLEHYLDFRGRLRKLVTSQTASVGATASGPIAQMSLSNTEANRTTVEAMKTLLQVLREEDLLDTARPVRRAVNDPRPFVLERCMSQRIMLPIKCKGPLDDLKWMTGWVSDPGPPYCAKAWDPDQTILFLLRADYADNERYHDVWSGMTILRLLFEQAGVTGTLLNDAVSRSNTRTPHELLKDAGASISEPFQIEALYRKRLISDEVFFEHDGSRRRMNALFAYPVWVAKLT